MNMILYFSGTGNSLNVAKTILKNIGEGKIVSMTNVEKIGLLEQYETIGFVYPTYFWGLPNIVEKYIKNIKIKNNTYYYAITTCGGSSGNALSQLNELLKKYHNIKLNYGETIKMQTNYILHNVLIYNYNFFNISKTMKSSYKMLNKIIDRIKKRENNKIKNINKFMESWYKRYMEGISSIDNKYIVNNDCVNCKICEKVCPVKNIKIKNGKPDFNHNCEHCLSCINYCPNKAINYGTITDKRKRYTNPEINYEELSKYNKI